MNEKMIVSIITICYNAETDIKKTIESVLNQNYKDIEYIIVDGKSTDSTMDIVEEYKANLNNLIKFKVISESDNGIYDAMNKGVKLATGEIIYFLNAGDVLYTNTIINEVSTYFKKNLCDIFYGDIAFKYKDKTDIKRNNKLTDFFFLKGDAICHQCIFAKREVFDKTGNFNLKYKICADRDWLLKCFKLKFKISHKNIVIAEYDMYGFSSGDEVKNQLRKEHDEIILDQYNYICYISQKIRHFMGRIKDMIISN